MPNYIYKCDECGHAEKMFLRISSDPSQKYDCPSCGLPLTMARKITKPGGIKGLKIFAGDWFRKTYGYDMAEGTERRVRERKDYEEKKRALEKEDGIRITHESRMAQGDKRISYPDKQE